MWRIDPGLKLPHKIPLDVGVSWVAAGAGDVWATNELAGLVYRIDPSTNKAHVVRRTDGPATVAVGGGAAWVSVAGPPPAGTDLPTSVCSKIAAGGEANPRFLIVSDLPLKGSEIATTHQMVEAIQLVLEQRGYRAGAYTIGYQSCDDSTAQGGGFDHLRCYWNAKAYARNPDVIGIIGSYNSGCSGEEIPVANQAPNGPLAMISPSSTVTDLTRLVPRCQFPATISSSCIRRVSGISFGRPAAGHLTATAMAQFAKQKGVKRLFLSWEHNALLGRIRRRRRTRSPVPGNPDRRRRSLTTRRRTTTIDSLAGSQRPAPTGSCWQDSSPPPPHCCAISAPASVAA